MTTLTYLAPGERGQHNFTTPEGFQMSAYIADGLPTPAPGTQVQVEIKQGVSKAGNAFSRIVSMNGQSAPPRSGGSFNGGGQPRTMSGGRPPMTYDARTFVSNVVGHAIAQGLIKTPDELAPWATTAYKTIKTLEPASVKTEIAAETPAATPGAPVSAPPQPAPIPEGGDDIPF